MSDGLLFDIKLTHRELVEVGYEWLLKNGGCGVAFKELKSINVEIPDVIGFCSWTSTVLECKVSRSDFLKDLKKSHRKHGMGDFRLYICPTGLIKKSELPERWGLIYVSPQKKATCIVNPQRNRGKYLANGEWEINNRFEKDREAEQQIMYTALRRLFIKGYFPSIYDKDYHGKTEVNHLIQLNKTK